MDADTDRQFSAVLMQSFTVCVMIGVSTDFFSFYLFLSVYHVYDFHNNNNNNNNNNTYVDMFLRPKEPTHRAAFIQRVYS